MKTAILIGCGAEIGSNLLIDNIAENDGFEISTVITKAPPIDKHYASLRPIDGIIARLAIARPGIQSKIEVVNENVLRINNRVVRFYFCDLRTDNPDISEHFDLAFLATNKADIAEKSPIVLKLREFADTILGVAEANDLPSIYGCLADLTENDIPTIKRQVIGVGTYCLGSCQTTGMHASLRVIIEALQSIDLNAKNILAIETDIVHPDTPNGVLGTRSFEGRMQDVRDNLRPSFSQITQSQHKVMPWAPLVNSVSLRVPVHAPGYQINRFIVNDGGLLNAETIEKAISTICSKCDYIVTASSTPLGSRAYAHDRRCATILSDNNHLLIIRSPYLSKQNLSEVIVQSYINNTIGYTAVVLAVARSVAFGKHIATFGGL